MRYFLSFLTILLSYLTILVNCEFQYCNITEYPLLTVLNKTITNNLPQLFYSFAATSIQTLKNGNYTHSSYINGPKGTLIHRTLMDQKESFIRIVPVLSIICWLPLRQHWIQCTTLITLL